MTLKHGPLFKNFCINKPGHPLDGHMRTMEMGVLPLFAKAALMKIRDGPMLEEPGLLGTSITVTDVEQRLIRLSQDPGKHG